MDAFKVRFLCARGRRSLMADIVSPEKRSQNMSAIRSKNTKPEVYLRKLLFAQGYRYRIADKSVPGHPDIQYGDFRQRLLLASSPRLQIRIYAKEPRGVLAKEV